MPPAAASSSTASAALGRLAAWPDTGVPRSHWRRQANSALYHLASVCHQEFYGSVRSTLMRILLLAQFFPPDIGGEERHVFNLSNTLAERGHDVTVATQRMVGVPDQETLASGVRVHRFATAAMRLPGVYSTSRTHHPPLPDPLGIRELSRIARQERPHVVHAQIGRASCRERVFLSV